MKCVERITVATEIGSKRISYLPQAIFAKAWQYESDPAIAFDIQASGKLTSVRRK